MECAHWLYEPADRQDLLCPMQSVRDLKFVGVDRTAKKINGNIFFFDCLSKVLNRSYCMLIVRQFRRCGKRMTRFQDHPVFVSEDTSSAPLSSAEVKAVRKLLEREKQRLMGVAPIGDQSEGPIDYIELVERIYRSRRDRERLFDDGIFADPAWDLLLDLFVRSERNEQVSISSACHAASVPEATALRYLKALTEKAYIERISHPNDKRSTTLKMTPLGRNLMMEWLDHFRSHR